MAARHDEHRRRQRQLAVRERERLDVAGEMMHRHDRDAARPGQRLRERDADEQRPDEPGPLRHGDGADRPSIVDAGLGERRLDDAADVADVLPRRELGDDAAPLAVDGGLRGDDAGADAARGGAASPVSATTAAAVSSHEVSMASRFIGRRPATRLRRRLLQRLAVRRR